MSSCPSYHLSLVKCVNQIKILIFQTTLYKALRCLFKKIACTIYYLRSLQYISIYPEMQPFLHCPLCLSHEESFRQ